MIGGLNSFTVMRSLKADQYKETEKNGPQLGVANPLNECALSCFERKRDPSDGRSLAPQGENQSDVIGKDLEITVEVSPLQRSAGRKFKAPAGQSQAEVGRAYPAISIDIAHACNGIPDGG